MVRSMHVSSACYVSLLNAVIVWVKDEGHGQKYKVNVEQSDIWGKGISRQIVSWHHTIKLCHTM